MLPSGVPDARVYHHFSRSMKANLSIVDGFFRYSGDLLQPIFERTVENFVDDYSNFKMKGVLIGYIPFIDEEEVWLSTSSLRNAASVGLIATALSRMARKDALCVLMQGAQSASFALGLPDSRRQEIKRKLLLLE